MVGVFVACGEKMVCQNALKHQLITIKYDINKNIAFLAPQKNGEKKLQVGGMFFLPQSPIWTVKLVPIMCEAKRHSQCSSRPT